MPKTSPWKESPWHKRHKNNRLTLGDFEREYVCDFESDIKIERYNDNYRRQKGSLET